jgi:ABC-type glycerol-3-phosphate transport system substrate-binding protein
MTGCSNKGNEEKEKEVAMGRYIEQTIDMPQAVQSGEEIAYLMKKNPEGKLEIYSSPMTAKEGESSIKYTLDSNNSWTRSVPKWLNEDELGDPKSELCDVSYAPDGNMYAVWSKNINDDKVRVKILKSTDGEKAEELDMKEFKEDVGYNRIPFDIEVLSDGSILLNFFGKWSVYKNGKVTSSFELGDYRYALNESTMLGLNAKQDGCIQVDVTTGKTITEIPFVNKSSNGAFTADKDGNWEMVSNTGIHRMAKGGNCWETILDGALASMSMPSMSTNSIVSGEKDDYYVMYESGGNGYRQIRHYIYNKDIPTTPSKTLSIVSLEENMTVRQAISDFQHENQDVKVDYKVLMSDNDGTTASDYIKKINTELLAGKGSDIIVMDGLPVDSYIEKGVLAELSNIVNPLINNKEVNETVMENSKKNGKFYSIPLKYSVTFAFGDKEAVSATKSIQALGAYAKNSAKTPIFGEGVLNKELIMKLYKYYSNNILKDNALDQDALTEFLKEAKVIAEQSKSESGELDEEYLRQEDMMNEEKSLMIYNRTSLLGLTDISDMYCIFGPLKALDKVGGDYASINAKYIPSGFLGINNASSQKKLAAKFITELYSEKVQKAELGDGFPVNIKALENYELAYDDFISTINDFEITQPSKEKMQKILELCRSVTTPITVDQTLFDMIETEAEAYISGNADLDSTVNKIMEKTKAYLNE